MLLFSDYHHEQMALVALEVGLERVDDAMAHIGKREQALR
jgi:hypothetical protein